MRPFVLLALVGPAVALHVGETLHEAFPDRFGVATNLRRVVEAGKTGFLTSRRRRSTRRSPRCSQVGDAPLTAEQVRDARSTRWPRRSG